MPETLIDHPCPDPGRPRVFELQPQDPRWESYVSRRTDALPYQDPAWSEVLREAFGFDSATLGCADHTGRITGILPLIAKKSLLGGPHLSSLPCTPIAGPCADDPSSLQALVAAAATDIDISTARWLQLKALDPGIGDLAHGFSRTPQGHTYILDLPDDPGEIRFGTSRNHSNVLRMVRQAQRQDVAVRDASSLRDVRRWYRLYLDTMRFYAALPKPFRLFEVMWAILFPQGRLRLLLAEKRFGTSTRLLAGCLYLTSGSTFVFAFNGRDRGQLQLKPNDAIHWQAINDACAAGFNRYDFGEAGAGNTGLRYFKQKWGTRAVQIYGYRYPRCEQGTPGPGSISGRADRVWRRIPLPATATLGGWIYRYL